MRADQDDQIIGKPAVLNCCPPSDLGDGPGTLQHLVHLIQVEVTEQRGVHRTLWYSLLACRFEQQLQQVYDLRIVHSPRDLCQHLMVSDVIEVRVEIEINNVGLPFQD